MTLGDHCTTTSHHAVRLNSYATLLSAVCCQILDSQKLRINLQGEVNKYMATCCIGAKFEETQRTAAGDQDQHVHSNGPLLRLSLIHEDRMR